jgi:hypothetical protein
MLAKAERRKRLSRNVNPFLLKDRALAGKREPQFRLRAV